MNYRLKNANDGKKAQKTSNPDQTPGDNETNIAKKRKLPTDESKSHSKPKMLKKTLEKANK